MNLQSKCAVNISEKDFPGIKASVEEVQPTSAFHMVPLYRPEEKQTNYPHLVGLGIFNCSWQPSPAAFTHTHTHTYLRGKAVSSRWSAPPVPQD